MELQQRAWSRKPSATRDGVARGLAKGHAKVAGTLQTKGNEWNEYDESVRLQILLATTNFLPGRIMKLPIRTSMQRVKSTCWGLRCAAHCLRRDTPETARHKSPVTFYLFASFAFSNMSMITNGIQWTMIVPLERTGSRMFGSQYEPLTNKKFDVGSLWWIGFPLGLILNLPHLSRPAGPVLLPVNFHATVIVCVIWIGYVRIFMMNTIPHIGSE